MRPIQIPVTLKDVMQVSTNFPSVEGTGQLLGSPFDFAFSDPAQSDSVTEDNRAPFRV